MGGDQSSLFGQCRGGYSPALFVVTGEDAAESCQARHALQWLELRAKPSCLSLCFQRAQALAKLTKRLWKLEIVGKLAELGSRKEWVSEGAIAAVNRRGQMERNPRQLSGLRYTSQPGRRVPVEREGMRLAESICKLSASLSTLFHSTVINFAASLGWFVCSECK